MRDSDDGLKAGNFEKELGCGSVPGAATEVTTVAPNLSRVIEQVHIVSVFDVVLGPACSGVVILLIDEIEEMKPKTKKSE